MTSTPGRLLLAAGATALAGLLCVLPATPAVAHPVLVRSTPAAGSVTATAPTEVVLAFSEPVRPVPGKVLVVGPDGQPATRAGATASERQVIVPLRPDGPRGTYLVSYRVIAADSHPVSGAFTYSVGAPSTTPPALPEEPTADPTIRAAIAVVRYLGYAGLPLLVGSALVLAALWPHRLPRTGPARLGWVGLGLVAASTLAGLVLQAPYTTGASLAGITPAGLRDVLGSPFGTAHLTRLGVLVAVALLLRPVLAGQARAGHRLLLALLGVVGLTTWPASGHPAGSPVPGISVTADAAHLAGMAAWLGGLVMLFTFLLRQADQRELAAILPVWGRWATLAIATLVLSGVLQALVEVGTPAALVGTGYGRLVLAKVGLFAAALAAAAYSRRLVRHEVAAARPGAVRRAAGVELAITATVLAVAAVLVQTTPGRTAEAEPPTGYAATLATNQYSLQVQVDPAQVGGNTLHLYAYRPGGRPLQVVAWAATAAMPPQRNVTPFDVRLVPVTDSHAFGEVTLPAAGEWSIEITLRAPDFGEASVTVAVPVR
ncbi:MAG TPA: copper resistance protein CopC [Micromonosporaceae bacterium]|nr:copper resistance protein CopC [Micromonosporaceae bacterium]